MGGTARGVKLSAEELSEQGRAAVNARWDREYEKLPQGVRRGFKLFRKYRALIESIERGGKHVCAECGTELDWTKLTASGGGQ